MDLIQFHSFIELWISLSLIRCDRFPCSLGLGFIGFYSSLPISNYFNRFDFIIRALDGFHVYWQFFRIVWGFTDQRSFLYFFFCQSRAENANEAKGNDLPRNGAAALHSFPPWKCYRSDDGACPLFRRWQAVPKLEVWRWWRPTVFCFFFGSVGEGILCWKEVPPPQKKRNVSIPLPRLRGWSSGASYWSVRFHVPRESEGNSKHGWWFSFFPHFDLQYCSVSGSDWHQIDSSIVGFVLAFHYDSVVSVIVLWSTSEWERMESEGGSVRTCCRQRKKKNEKKLSPGSDAGTPHWLYG